MMKKLKQLRYVDFGDKGTFISYAENSKNHLTD